MSSLDDGVSAMVAAIEKEVARSALPGLTWKAIDVVLRVLLVDSRTGSSGYCR